MQRVRVIDSHTEGEPTRVVIEGGPDLGPRSIAERAREFRERCDWFRSAVVNEPRGSEALVGALLVEPDGPGATAGVIFFNNVGVLGGCGHGTIGLVRTLAHMGRLGPGTHGIDTPVGRVQATLHEDGAVSMENVPAYRHAAGVVVEVPWAGAEAGARRVTGDVVWGGNWFFICHDHGVVLDLAHLDDLTRFARAVRTALERAGITGREGASIDHVELVGPSPTPGRDARNFVLCPGGAYDRSPCGTGTSAKVACLAADGKLKPSARWVQESVIGSAFEAHYRVGSEPGSVIPTIRGRAWITAESTLLIDPADPYAHGIRP